MTVKLTRAWSDRTTVDGSPIDFFVALAATLTRPMAVLGDVIKLTCSPVNIES